MSIRSIVYACTIVIIVAGVPAMGQVDLTGDGKIEIALGNPGDGRLTILDGASGQQLWSATDMDMFGWAVSAHPDVDSDGLADVLVSAPGTGAAVPGRVVAMRGSDGAVLWTCTFGPPVARFGLGLGVIPDQDGDGVVDLLVAMLSNDSSGEAVVLVSGKKGTVLSTVPGPFPTLLSATRTGQYVFKPKDLNRSGVVDGEDIASVVSALGSRVDAVDFDFSGTVDSDDLMIIIEEMTIASPMPMLPGEYALLSLEDPLRYNDGYSVVALTLQPGTPAPPDHPCAAEYEAMRQAARDWANHMLTAPINPLDPRSINPIE